MGTAGDATPTVGRFPATVLGRNILDQNGGVYLMRTFSSWAMAQQLSDAEITQALEDVAGNRFNAVTVWIGGGFNNGAVERVHQREWRRRSGPVPPYQSRLGSGWATSTGSCPRPPDWASSPTCRSVAAPPAAVPVTSGRPPTQPRCATPALPSPPATWPYPHIVWHIMFDDNRRPSLDPGSANQLAVRRDQRYRRRGHPDRSMGRTRQRQLDLRPTDQRRLDV